MRDSAIMADFRILCVSLLLMFVTTCQGYFISVDAHEEVCFHDRVSSGTKLGLTFEVIEGGFLDIDVKVGRLSVLSSLYE